jgi:hypothetical protein
MAHSELIRSEIARLERDLAMLQNNSESDSESDSESNNESNGESNNEAHRGEIYSIKEALNYMNKYINGDFEIDYTFILEYDLDDAFNESIELEQFLDELLYYGAIRCLKLAYNYGHRWINTPSYYLDLPLKSYIEYVKEDFVQDDFSHTHVLDYFKLCIDFKHPMFLNRECDVACIIQSVDCLEYALEKGFTVTNVTYTICEMLNSDACLNFIMSYKINE